MCTIGYFEHDGKRYAGKNREPGKNSLDTLVVRTRHIKEPVLFYVGIDPEVEVDLADEIVHVAEDRRYLELERDLGIHLYKLSPKQTLPSELKDILSNNIWGGIYLNKHVGMPAASPTKAIFIIPHEGQTTVGNYSHYNLERCWGGVNESGIFMQSSSIRHEGRIMDRPSYSVITNDILLDCENVEQALNHLRHVLNSQVNNSPGGANFLIADGNDQVIVEYIPSDVLKSGKAKMIVTQGGSQEFRSNFGLESMFFHKDGWDLKTANEEQKEHFIRSINRLLVAYEQSGPDVFASHRVYKDLFDDQILAEVHEMMKSGELLEVGLSSPTQFASFYSICTHPVMQGDEHTYKRTFWNMIADLTDNKVKLTYDNTCQSGADIIIDPRKIDVALRNIQLC